MKKVKVVVKDKYILELAEDATCGDIIDLKELAEVDTSYIESVLEAGKDKIYENKLSVVKKSMQTDATLIQNKLQQEMDSLTKQNALNLQIKEKEVREECLKQINELNQKLAVQKKEQESLQNSLNQELVSKLKLKEQEVGSTYLTQIADLKHQLELKEEQEKASLERKEQEVEKKYLDQVNQLKNQLDKLTEGKTLELDNLNQKHQLELKEKEQTLANKYQELEKVLEQEKAKGQTALLQKEMEVKEKYLQNISELKTQNEVLTTHKEQEISAAKIQVKLECDQILSAEKDTWMKQLQEKDQIIANFQRQRGRMNVKQTGEDLEGACDNLVKDYMQNGFTNCTWTKDNLVVKNDDQEKGSKADFIFKVFSTNEHLEKDLLTSVCLDMKDENPDSKQKQTNEHYYAKLEENRKKKNCYYSALVSNLEMDKSNDLCIYKVPEYPNMYVVRPAFLMVFLNMVVSLTTRFQDLLMSQEAEQLKLKSKQEILDEFEKIKSTYLDSPLQTLETQITAITKSTDSIRKASSDIDTACEKITTRYINQIEDKLSKFELKLNKAVINKIDE